MMIDLTQIVLTAEGAIVTIGVSVFMAWLSSHMKDKQAAATIATAVQNSVGIVQKAVADDLQAHPLQVNLPTGTSASTAAGVQYVLNQAGLEIKRFPEITPASIAEKIDAKLGVAPVALLSIAPAVHETASKTA